MSTVALSRNPSKASALLGAVMAFGQSVRRMLAACVKTDRDRRLLQTLPDHVLADMGLERIELPYGPDGDRHVWVGRTRHF